jgi:hypothetical protein
MGRKSYEAHGYVTRERLERARAAHKTVPRIAAFLGIAENTVRKYSRRWGFVFKPGRPRGRARGHGSLIRWVRAHKDVPLPRSVHAIHVLTGCTEDAIKAYLKRQRREIREYLRGLPDLKRTALRLRAASGTVIPLRVVKRYALTFSPWSFRIRLCCTVGAKTLTREFTLKAFKRYMKEA